MERGRRMGRDWTGHQNWDHFLPAGDGECDAVVNPVFGAFSLNDDVGVDVGGIATSLLLITDSFEIGSKIKDRIGKSI